MTTGSVCPLCLRVNVQFQNEYDAGDQHRPKPLIALNWEALAISPVYSASSVQCPRVLTERQFPFHGQVSITMEMLISCSSCPWLHQEHQKHSDKENCIYFCVSESSCLGSSSSSLLKLSTRSNYQCGSASLPVSTQGAAVRTAIAHFS